MGALESKLVITLVDNVSARAKTAAGAIGNVAHALDRAGAAAKAIDAGGFTTRFTSALSRFGLSARDIDKVSDAWRRYGASIGLAADRSKWTGQQVAQVRAWETATVAALRNAQRESERVQRETSKPGRVAIIPGHIGGVVAGAVGAHAIKRGAEKVIHTYREFDDLVRYQRAILGLTESQQKPLIDQALTLGATTKFNDLQVLEAQLDLAQRGVQRDAIIPITNAAAHFAQALGTDLPTAAKTLEGILFSTGKDMHDTAAAVAAANKAASFATKLAKIGGLNEEDVRQFFKYGGASGMVAGLSDPTLGAIAAILRRSNIRGDEAGVAARAFAGKLVAPTNKGMAALATLGIDYNKFTRMPGALSAENLATKFKQDFGRDIPAPMRQRLAEVMADEEVVGDRGEFTARVTEILGELFPKNKKGQLLAKDRQAIAKKVGEFHKLAVDGVDSEGLLRAIIESHPTLAQLNAIFGEKQGGRFAILAKAGLPLFLDYVEKLVNAGDDFHEKISKERMEGFAGAVSRAEGALMNFTTAVGRANDELGKGAFNTIAEWLNKASKVPPEALRLGAPLELPGLIANGVGILLGEGGKKQSWWDKIFGPPPREDFTLGSVRRFRKSGTRVEGFEPMPEYLQGIVGRGAFEDTGRSTGAAYRSGLMDQLRSLEAEIDAIIGRIKGKLNFDARPSISPMFAPAPSAPAQPSPTRAAARGLYSDYDFGGDLA